MLLTLVLLPLLPTLVLLADSPEPMIGIGLVTVIGVLVLVALAGCAVVILCG